MTSARDADGSATPARRRAPDAHQGDRVSYLVRFWQEPHDDGSDAVYLRGYARDLKSGEESYFTDPRRFAEYVLRRLHEREGEDARDAAGSSRRAATA